MNHPFVSSAQTTALTSVVSPKAIVLAVALALQSVNVFADAHSHLDLENVPVTGNPLGVGSDALVVPVTVVGGRELSLRRESTLGEILNGTPGVTATQFGPNASRPVIRGLDAERVKIMQNGVGVLDASSLSFDHAVGVDPLIIEQIDVVRGPAALLYGGSAIGGVVNAIDHRIPREALNGITGRAETRFGGPQSSRNSAAVFDAGNGKFAMHVDYYTRTTGDLDIPSHAVSKRLGATGVDRSKTGKLPNSDAQAEGGAIGAAWTFDDGYLGVSYADDNNNYGVVAEEGVRVDLDSQRWDVAGEVTNIKGSVHRLKARLAHTDYQHVEIENGAVGTTFKNRGMEGGVEAGHVPVLGLNGVLGYQFQNTQFEALGDEAFVPSVTTQTQAVYVYEELPIAKHKLTFGGRMGETTQQSHINDKFTTEMQRRFKPSSIAFGGLYNINEAWNFTTNLSRNERAPSYFELFADGAHVATGQYEVGDKALREEVSTGLDAQFKWSSGKDSFTMGAYVTRFKNFIALVNTNNMRGADGELNPIDLNNDSVADISGEDILPETRFVSVPALFKGLEFEAHHHLTDNIGLSFRGDYVHAKDTRNNDYLPRISPLRLGAGINYQQGPFYSRLDVLHAFKQDDTAANEIVTDSYTNVSAMVAYKFRIRHQPELFAKVNNLLNDDIREHASFLKDRAPAVGQRAIMIGLRAVF